MVKISAAPIVRIFINFSLIKFLHMPSSIYMETASASENKGQNTVWLCTGIGALPENTFLTYIRNSLGLVSFGYHLSVPWLGLRFLLRKHEG